jgi:hypothetical protein
VLREVLVDELGQGESSPDAAPAPLFSSARSSAARASASLLKPPRCTRLESRPPVR